jgi:hypothetical protein
LTLTGCLGIASDAFALVTQAATCANMNTTIASNGLIASYVQCIRDQLLNAVTAYSAQISTALAVPITACVTLSVVFFGLRVATQSMEKPLAETMLFLFKLAIAATLIKLTPQLYTYAAGVMDTLLGITVGTLTPVPTGCTVKGNFPASYAVWQDVDCIITTITGDAANPVNILSSLLIVIAVALLSQTLGVAVALFGIITIVSFLLLIARTVFVFLMAYMAVGFLLLLTPLMAPLLVFNSHTNKGYGRQIFNQWLDYIISSMLEPLFLVGFLSFAVLVINVFVNGTIPNCKVVPNALIPGAATQGANDWMTICSYKQLFPNVPAMLEPGASFGSWKTANDILRTAQDMVQEDVQNGAQLGNAIVNFDIQKTVTQARKTVVTAVVGPVSHTFQLAGDLVISGFTRLRATISFMTQCLLSLGTLLITINLIAQIQKKVPRIARSVSGGASLGLLSAVEAPLEKVIRSATDKAASAAYASVAGAGGMGLGNLGGLFKATTSAGKAATGTFVDRARKPFKRS